MHNEDRELQIKLSVLQADVQIAVASAFGFAAVLISIYAIIVQTFFSLPAEARSSLAGLLLVIGMLIVWGTLGFAFNYFLRKAIASRNEMELLKKEYCW